MHILSSALAPLAALVPLAALAVSGASAAVPEYSVTQTVALGAPDRWDYVIFDPSSTRVYVAHGDEVTVVDADSGALISRIKGFPGGTHGVAIVPGVGRGYTDEGETGKADSFNLQTMKVEKQIPAADDADAMTFDPASNHVFVMNGDTGSITVIDPKTDMSVATIDLGSKLEYAVPSGDGKLFVNGAGARVLFVVDTTTNTVVAKWPLPNCESPHGLGYSAASHRLFVSCLNEKLQVVDSQNGHVVATVAIGKGSDAVAVDPKRKLIFSSNGKDGTLSVIQEQDPAHYVALSTIETAVTGRTMGINPQTGRLFIAAADVVKNAAPDAKTGRYRLVPGSLKLIFLDPTH